MSAITHRRAASRPSREILRMYRAGRDAAWSPSSVAPRARYDGRDVSIELGEVVEIVDVHDARGFAAAWLGLLCRAWKLHHARVEVSRVTALARGV